MRKLALIVLAVFLIFSTAYASTNSIGQGMADKALRGIMNLFTGILEVPYQIYKGYHNGFEPIQDQTGSKMVGAVAGFFRGVGHALGRTSWGALELAGFWTANPVDNKGVGIPLDAEYAWEMGTQYSVFKPSLAEGVKPIGRKLGHGVADSLLGIAELPGQTMKGAKNGNVLVGFTRGIWYWFSREVYGFGNVATCIVPNPEDNPGYAFNGLWPWSSLSSEAQK